MGSVFGEELITRLLVQQEIINVLVASISTKIQQIVNLGLLRDLREQLLQQLRLLQLDRLNLQIALTLHNFDWRTAQTRLYLRV